MRAGEPAAVTVEVDGIAWPVTGAQVAILDGDRVMVQFRPWPPGWELPGGHCEPEEDPAVTAAREAEEETGYRVRIDAVVGVYTWDGLRRTGDVLYRGSIAGGAPRRSIEAWASRLVDAEHMPRTLFPWLRERIADALTSAAGEPPIHRVQPVTLYHVASFATDWMRTPVDRMRRLRQRGGRP
ncbi:MAG: NUDIX domain-containing protein [Candidatus Dormibacteraeota bacterium]|nr:NUDIX domain-containing protein [Candidatus Dormibacteraeota bacterium]MBV9525777.1 NUDIX domain-containing protein [Candidatus Dormibacteraeota bacterium]